MIRGTVTIECDRPKCYAELVVDVTTNDANIQKWGLTVEVGASGWRVDDDGQCWCPECAERADERDDEAYERAAARARNNDFADTGGKDWT
jgi:hypothetical protein